MKRIILLLMAFTFMCSSAYAYSLDDIKNDYPALKIKEDTLSSEKTVRSLVLIALNSHTNIFYENDFEILLYEFSYGKKHVTAYASHHGFERTDLTKVTLISQNDSYDIFPQKPLVSTIDNSFLEILPLDINTEEELLKWKNAEQIRICGKEQFFELSTGTIDYAKGMDIIHRFLFE